MKERRIKWKYKWKKEEIRWEWEKGIRQIKIRKNNTEVQSFITNSKKETLIFIRVLQVMNSFVLVDIVRVQEIE